MLGHKISMFSNELVRFASQDSWANSSQKKIQWKLNRTHVISNTEENQHNKWRWIQQPKRKRRRKKLFYDWSLVYTDYLQYFIRNQQLLWSRPSTCIEYCVSTRSMTLRKYCSVINSLNICIENFTKNQTAIYKFTTLWAGPMYILPYYREFFSFCYFLEFFFTLYEFSMFFFCFSCKTIIFQLQFHAVHMRRQTNFRKTEQQQQPTQKEANTKKIKTIVNLLLYYFIILWRFIFTSKHEEVEK